MLLIACLAVVLAATSSSALSDPAISESLFYPFGSDVGHNTASSEVEMCLGSYSIIFNGETSQHIGISENGVIGLATVHGTFTWVSHYPRIAPFWCDVKSPLYGNPGRLFYHHATGNQALLRRASLDVQQSFPSASDFQATFVVTVTWHNVTYTTDNSQLSPRNTFQAVLISNGVKSFAMFNYAQLNYFSPTKSLPTILPTTNDRRCFSGFYHQNSQARSTSDRFQKVVYPSNPVKNCRRFYRIDGQITEANSTCEDHGCAVYQTYDISANKCINFAPAFDSPRLEGPVVNGNWVEFYCVVPTKEFKKDAIFNVTFLFNGRPSEKHPGPSLILQPPYLKATLHEKHLAKNLGKRISCQVSSFWKNIANSNQTRPVISENDYWAGIEVNPKTVSVNEGSSHPVLISVKSTIPITCGSKDKDCDLKLQIKSDEKVLVRKKDSGICSHVLRAKDWKTSEQKAYNEEIELFAKIDPAVSAPRLTTMRIEVDTETQSRKRTLEGEEYENMWSDHIVEDVKVYHLDTPQGVCRSTGDPHVTTFDRSWYTIYPSGQFTYVQTTRGTPIEVQVRHGPCTNRQWVSCVCGVAMREDDVIIAADRCGGDYRTHFITYGDDREGAEIRRSAGGHSFELILPSGVKALAYVNYYGITLQIQVTSSEFQRVEGLCGNFDGIGSNDLMVKGQKRSTSSVDQAVESWRVPLGKSLFDGVSSDLSYSLPPADDTKCCTCAGNADPSCSTSRADVIPSANDNSVKVTPKRPPSFRGGVSRRRRSADNETVPLSDDTDYEYDSTAFRYVTPVPSRDLGDGSWPSDNNVTEAEARSHCRKVLWDDSPVKKGCQNFVKASDVNAIIEKCVTDIKLVDDLAWALDKISEIQNLCVFEAITTNVTEKNVKVEDIMRDIVEMTALICVPQDCSGHGQCKNGTCDCDKGYIGSDCALSESAEPKIVRKLGQPECDLSKSLCKKVDLLTKDTVESQNLSCKVQLEKTSESDAQDDVTTGMFETSQTMSCHLPTDDVIGDLRLLQGHGAQPIETVDKDFESLPLGNPVLHYTVSISNNRARFSNALSFYTYDSTCFTCAVGGPCVRKPDTCLIRGYCFTKHQKNPLFPTCEYCDPSKSLDMWTRFKTPGSGAVCESCEPNPCPRGTICLQRSRGRIFCEDDGRIVFIVSAVTVVAVILTAAAVFLIIRCPAFKCK